MIFNSLYQYSWNALEPLLEKGFNADLVSIQLGYSLFNIFSTIFQIFGGIISDKKGPKLIGIFSSILSALGFLGTSFSSDLFSFYVFWSIGSIGEGILYGIAANLAIKWFSDRRGLATGIVSLGFGVGATIFNPFILYYDSFRIPTLIIGILEIIILPILLYFSNYPNLYSSGLSPKEIVLDKSWWLVYFSFVTASVPLMIISSSLYQISNNKISKDIITLLITIFPLLSGIGRPLLGLISDKVGEFVMVISLNVALSLSMILLILGILIPSITLIGFFGGSLITIYFSFLGELYGIKYSTSNTAMLYTGKAISGFLGSVLFSYIFLLNKEFAILYGLICSLSGTLLIIIAYKKKVKS
jgi:OFA family oxalate/formate antiporter-like MFS transporter